MQEQPRRKPRIPLTPEELFYVMELKKLKKLQKLQSFKGSTFYKTTNCLNILYAAFLTYAIISNLMLCYWQKAYVEKAVCSYAGYVPEAHKRTIGIVDLYLTNGDFIKVRTSDFFNEPKPFELVYLGKDYLFDKVVKVQFTGASRPYWNENAIASTIVSVFALMIGCFVYLVNKHLTVNGLLMTLGMFTLASLYFIFV